MADLQSAALATWLRSHTEISLPTGFSGVWALGQDGSSFDPFHGSHEKTSSNIDFGRLSLIVHPLIHRQEIAAFIA